MRNFHFLLAAWITVWAVFFVYEFSVAQPRMPSSDDIERLKRQLKTANAASVPADTAAQISTGIRITILATGAIQAGR